MVNEDRIRSDRALLMYYIKYYRLDEINANIVFNNSKVVDIYIDLYDLIKVLYQNLLTNNSGPYTIKQFSIASSIINLAAHMRGYYRTRQNIWSRIFLIYADELCNNHSQYWPSFSYFPERDHYNYTVINAIVESQLNLVKILAGYINDVYYIHKHANFAIVSNDIITKYRDPISRNISIILSRSRYAYQIPAIHLSEAVYQIKPVKHKDDTSIIIAPTDVLQVYFNKISPKSSARDKLALLSPRLLSLLWTINGFDGKNIPLSMNIIRTIYMVYDAINNLRILNDYNSDPEFVYNNLIGISDIITKDEFVNRFRALDLIYQHQLYMNTPESLDTAWFINLQDPDTMKYLNNKYFVNNPLDLGNF